MTDKGRLVLTENKPHEPTVILMHPSSIEPELSQFGTPEARRAAYNAAMDKHKDYVHSPVEPVFQELQQTLTLDLQCRHVNFSVYTDSFGAHKVCNDCKQRVPL